MTSRSMKLLLATLAVSLCGCAASNADRIRSLQDGNRRLRADVEALSQAVEGGHAYAQRLQGPTPNGTLTLLLTPADIDQLSQKVLPYRIPARTLNSMLSGDVVIDRITQVRFLPGNKLTCQAWLHGEKLRVTASIPPGYKQQVSRFVAGVTAGVITDLTVSLSWQQNSLFARAHAQRSVLRTNRDPQNEARLTNGMNDTALRRTLLFDLGLEGTPMKVDFVTTTANHLVVGYAQ